MPEVTLEQAAIALGVSVDTVRRRIRLGQLAARRNGSGRSVVDVPAAPALPAEIERLRREEHEQLAALQLENAHLAALVEELRRHEAELEAHNALLREQLVSEAEAQRDLRRLLANAQEQLGRLLPGA